MKEPTGLIGYFLAAQQMRRERLTIEKIRDGDDPDLQDLLVSIVTLELNDVTDNVQHIRKNHIDMHRDNLESRLREVLVTPGNPALGKKRRKLLRRAGYDVYICGEEDPAIATIGVRVGDSNFFAPQPQ